MPRHEKTLKSTIKRYLHMQVPTDATEEEHAKIFSKGKSITALEVIALKQMQKALAGDLKAAAFVREVSGEDKKVEKTGLTFEEFIKIMEQGSA